MEIDSKNDAVSRPWPGSTVAKCGLEAAATDVQQPLVAATALPYTPYYLSGAARARIEVFLQRGRLTRELTALGLPPLYEHPVGVFVGQQVSTEPEAGADRHDGPRDRRPTLPSPSHKNQVGQQQPQQQRVQQSGPDWRRLRGAAAVALNPARNPVMARNIRLKAQLAQPAARGAAAAAAAKPRPSGRLSRHRAAMDDAERTTAKLLVVARGGGGGEGGEGVRLGSAPLSKPYYPRRRVGGVPANESEGGDLMPGRLARRAAGQVAEAAMAAEGKQRMGRRRGARAAEQRRQARIEEIADVILAAPKLGIRELGVFLPRELATLADSSEDASTAAPATITGTTPAAATTGELAEALRLLELCTAAGRAAVAAAENDYGSHFVVASGRGSGGDGGGGGAIPALSPVASSYGSGGHYLYEEGMTEGDEEGDLRGSGSGGGSSADDGGSGSGDGADDSGVHGGGAYGGLGVARAAIRSSGGSGGGAAAAEAVRSRYPEKVTVEADPRVGLLVVRYPARRRARARRGQEGSYEAAGGRSEQVTVSNPAAAPAAAPMVNLEEAMRRPDAQPGNEVTGGTQRRRRPDTGLGGPDPPATSVSPLPPPEGAAQELAASHDAAAAVAAAAAAAAAMIRLPNETSYAGRVRQLQQPEIAGKDLSGVWAEAAVAAARRSGPAAGGRRAQVAAAAATTAESAPQDAASAAMTPPWRRESHSERGEALLEAAARAAAAAAAVVGDSAQNPSGAFANPSADLGGPGTAGGGGSGGGQRVAVRAGRPPVAIARPSEAPDRGGGGCFGSISRVKGPGRWDGAQIGRAVAVAVAVLTVPAAAGTDAVTSEVATAVAGMAGSADTVAAAVSRSETAASPSAATTACAAGGAAAAIGPSSASPAAADSEDSTAARLATVLARTDSPGGGGGAHGLSLERFSMLSDAESEDGAVADADEDDRGAEAEEGERGAGRAAGDEEKHHHHRHHHHQQQQDVEEEGRRAVGAGRGGAAEHRRSRGNRGGVGSTAAAAEAAGNPWDSDSDDNNPWGVEDADEQGYPLLRLLVSDGHRSVVAAAAAAAVRAAAAPAPRQHAAAHAAEGGAGADGTWVSVPASGRGGAGPQAKDGGGCVGNSSSGGSSSAGSWGVDHRGPTGARAHHPGQVAAAAGSLIAQALRRMALAGGYSGSAALGAAASRRPGGSGDGGGGGGGLRQLYGLATEPERVVDPRDVPPLTLTPPPDWLVMGARGAANWLGTGRKEAQAGAAAVGAVGSRPAMDDMLSRELSRPMGRVEAALLRAEDRVTPARIVQHDDCTFYFSEYPIY